MDSKRALEVLKEVGIYRLVGFDGCLCGECATNGVNIDISCRKSSGSMRNIDPEFYGVSVRVHSRHSDSNNKELQVIADEVKRQLIDEGYDIAIRLCDWMQDEKCVCGYCGKPRQGKLDYLCDACKRKPEASGLFVEQISAGGNSPTDKPADIA